MSNLAKYGLLEGLGRGIALAGDNMGRVALEEARQRREDNLLKIRREWQLEDRAAMIAENDKVYTRNRTDQIADQDTARINQLADSAKARQYHLEDRDTIRGYQLKDRQFSVDNREPSAFNEKASFLKQELDAGRISEAEYKQAMGYTSDTMAGLTRKDALKMIGTLRSDYAKSMEMVPEGQRQSFEQWARQNRPEEWRALGGGSSSGDGGGENSSSSQPTRQPTDGQIKQMYSALMKQDPSTWDGEIQALKDRGYTIASNKLRSMLQEDRRRLSKDRQETADSTKYRTQREQFNIDPRRRASGFGLLEGTSTLH